MKKPYKDCRYPWDNIQILANGVVKPCCWMEGKNINWTMYGVGNLNESTFEEIWNGEDMQDIRKHITEGKVHPYCKDRPCPFNTSEQIYGID